MKYKFGECMQNSFLSRVYHVVDEQVLTVHL